MNSIREEEARTRWCPFARNYTFPGTGDPTPLTVNRQKRGAPEIGCLCVASECMAWRWDRPVLGLNYGHCGLAGGVDT
jgi:hypothetical protein